MKLFPHEARSILEGGQPAEPPWAPLSMALVNRKWPQAAADSGQFGSTRPHHSQSSSCGSISLARLKTKCLTSGSHLDLSCCRKFHISCKTQTPQNEKNTTVWSTSAVVLKMLEMGAAVWIYSTAVNMSSPQTLYRNSPTEKLQVDLSSLASSCMSRL